MQCRWYVHECGQRWTRAIRAFGYRALPREEDRLNVLPLPLLDSAIDKVVRDHAPVVLWELPNQAPSKQLQAIAYVRNANPSSVQFVAFHQEATLTPKIQGELVLCLREIGAANVLSQVTDLVLPLKAVRRLWQLQRQEDNLATARIWDRLPWTP